jgi:hypothetical protein
MKTQITKAPEVFKPVSIEITFETQRELDAFGSLMNHARIGKAVENLGRMEQWTILEKIAKPLHELGADIGGGVDAIDDFLKKAYQGR